MNLSHQDAKDPHIRLRSVVPHSLVAGNRLVTNALAARVGIASKAWAKSPNEEVGTMM